jgi:hypothetical protein
MPVHYLVRQRCRCLVNASINEAFKNERDFSRLRLTALAFCHILFETLQFALIEDLIHPVPAAALCAQDV